MTMLDRMRRHMSWLKWSLGLVCLAFIIFYIPDFLRGNGADAASGETIARVDGQDITANEFRRTYQAQLQAYRSAYGGQMNEQLLKQLGVEQQILQQMVDERAALAEARRVGIVVSDTEVRQRILSIPAFQENGAFIGEQRYQQLLRMQRPPMTAADFEDNVRRQLTIQKLRSSLTDWLSVADKDLEQEYRRRNDKVKLAVVSFTADSFRTHVTASDADIATYFDGHKDEFKIPEKRKIRYLLIDVEAMRAKVVVPPADVERTYNNNVEQYSTPEQVRASHILLKTDGKDDAAVKAKAEDVLKQARGGADFAELARKYSEDEASQKNGGDLDYFGRGRMVAEFDQVAFALEPGKISDLVKTQYGYHIIKVVDKKAATTRPLQDVRQQIQDQLAYERAQAQASDLAQGLEKEVTKPADLDRVAKEKGLTVQESGFFARDEPILGLGPSPEAASRAFDMKPGDVAGPLRASRGFVFETLLARQDPYVPKLDEVKERVRDEVVKQKARDLSQQKAAEIAAKLKTAADFEKAAKAAGFEAKTTDLIARDAPIPDLGVAKAVEDAAFRLPVGAVSDAVPTDNGTAVIKVLDKQEVTPADWANAKDRFREELLTDRRSRFFGAYMVKAKQKMKIEVNRESLQRATS
ncbi:MAG TPA: SurA N-terminal domain-containing protein [Vicinamibacterales bacterium]|jgi:peptidyl-prolyl cis-trans isomerase D|nr:SurA N-terminal domain-containing protein [Vicinamibacterales bacterium]